MTQEIAQLVVLAGTAVAWLVWSWGYRRWRRLGVSAPTAEADTFELEPPAAGSASDLVADTLDVPGEPAALSERLARRLAAYALGGGPIDQVALLEQTPARLRFLARTRTTRHGSAAFHGAVAFEPLPPGRTRVAFAVDLTPVTARLRRVLGFILFALGVPVLVGLPLLLLLVAAPSPHPAVRWQVLQIFQAVHVLWPPFLLAYIDRRIRRAVASSLRTLLTHLPSA